MVKISTFEIGNMDSPPIVFGHGWGRDHKDFLPIAELVAHRSRAILLDFPGFGGSPRPKKAWNTVDYAKAVKKHLMEHGLKRYYWVGHSFGGRVGLRLAAMSESPVEQLFVVAGAGVKRPQKLSDGLKRKLRSWVFQRRKAHAQTEDEIIELEKRFGSLDYVHSREIGLRDIFLKTVQEDQTKQLSTISCPTTLIYGEKDTETPPEIGQVLHQLISGSVYVECPEFDHHSILTRGRHQVATMLLEQLSRGDR